MNFFCDGKIIEINGNLFLKEDSNNFFNYLLSESSNKTTEKVDYLSIYRHLKENDIEYKIIILPDKVVFCKNLFDENFFIEQKFINRPTIVESKKFNFIHYTTNKFGLNTSDIVEIRDTHLTSQYIVKYIYDALNQFSQTEIDEFIYSILQQSYGFGGDLFDMLSSNTNSNPV